MRITYKETRQRKTGKVTYTTYKEKPWKRISEQEYKRRTSDGTLAFFRSSGGSEYVVREYTFAGYLITSLVSKSPDRDEKVIREFRFHE